MHLHILCYYCYLEKLKCCPYKPSVSQPDIKDIKENTRKNNVYVLNHGLCPFRTHGLVKEKDNSSSLPTEIEGSDT